MLHMLQLMPNIVFLFLEARHFEQQSKHLVFLLTILWLNSIVALDIGNIFFSLSGYNGYYEEPEEDIPEPDVNLST